MTMVSRVAAGWALAVLVGGCGGDSGTGPGTGSVSVDSDPRGAAITLDGSSTGLRTPSTVPAVSTGKHTIGLRLDSAGTTFGLETQVQVAGAQTVATGVMPLVVRCNDTGNCVGQAARFHEVASLYFATNPAATPLFTGGRGGGLKYPGAAGDSYASAAGPVFSAKPSNFGQYIALGLYQFGGPLAYPPLWAGRPIPADSVANGGLVVHANTWYAPPSALADAFVPRGIQADQRIVGSSTVTGALLIRVVFRNISATPAYRLVDPDMPSAGLTYTDAYIGYALDADIGGGNADLYTFEPSLLMSVMYNGAMEVPGFSNVPSLVGLRMVQPPAGATTVALGAWLAAADWLVADQQNGHQILTVAGRTGIPVYPNATTVPGDYRVSVAAGPLNLAPGDSATCVVALIVAPPAPGTYTPGTLLRPGDPADPTRPFEAVAAPLVQRARAAEALLGR